jgi:hypothetical protein
VPSSSPICKSDSIIYTAIGATNYTWQPNGIASNTLGMMMNSSTIFTVVGSGSTTCLAKVIQLFSTSQCVGIEENNAAFHQLKLWPNPSQGLINVLSQSDLKIKVLNQLGQVLYEQDLKQNTVSEINLLIFSAGVYYIESQSAQGNSTHKIVSLE